VISSNLREQPDRGTILRAVTRAPYDVILERVPVPVVGPYQLGVVVRRIGICGTDLHVYVGDHPFVEYPVVMGHEAVGEVAEIGDDVRGFNVGDHVAIRPQVVCGACEMCDSHRENLCESLRVLGIHTTGASQEFIVVGPDQAIRLPSEMAFDLAVLVEPVAVAIHAVEMVRRPIQKALVLGAGTIGNLVGQVAALGGADVVVCDIAPVKLKVAEAVGLHGIDARAGDLNALVGHRLPGGPDFIAECVGSDQVIASAIRLAPRGATIVVVGVHSMPATIEVGLIQLRELIVRGSRMYVRADFDKAIELLEAGLINAAGLLSHHYQLGELPTAYREVVADRGSVMKAVIFADEYQGVGGHPKS
jgi:L-iditol 2-dehydrogenase